MIQCLYFYKFYFRKHLDLGLGDQNSNCRKKTVVLDGRSVHRLFISLSSIDLTLCDNDSVLLSDKTYNFTSDLLLILRTGDCTSITC